MCSTYPVDVRSLVKKINGNNAGKMFLQNTSIPLKQTLIYLLGFITKQHIINARKIARSRFFVLSLIDTSFLIIYNKLMFKIYVI